MNIETSIQILGSDNKIMNLNINDIGNFKLIMPMNNKQNEDILQINGYILNMDNAVIFNKWMRNMNYNTASPDAAIVAPIINAIRSIKVQIVLDGELKRSYEIKKSYLENYVEKYIESDGVGFFTAVFRFDKEDLSIFRSETKIKENEQKKIIDEEQSIYKNDGEYNQKINHYETNKKNGSIKDLKIYIPKD